MKIDDEKNPPDVYCSYSAVCLSVCVHEHERASERDCEHLHRRLIKFHIEHLHVFKLRSEMSVLYAAAEQRLNK
jgi:hypothetical protein